MTQQQCRYCDSPADADHKDTCPTKDANPEWAMAEWKRGFNDGIEYGDRNYWWHCGSALYRRGYSRGLVELGEMLEAAESCRQDPEY